MFLLEQTIKSRLVNVSISKTKSTEIICTHLHTDTGCNRSEKHFFLCINMEYGIYRRQYTNL